MVPPGAADVAPRAAVVPPGTAVVLPTLEIANVKMIATNKKIFFDSFIMAMVQIIKTK